MATRLYTYGEVKTVTQQGDWLPGRFATAWGVNLNAPAVKASNLAIEYGELVKLVQKGLDSNAYTIERVAAGTTQFGVILRTTDGQVSIEEGFIERPRNTNVLSVYPLSAPNYFVVAVPIIASQNVTIGATPSACIVSGSEGAVQVGTGNGGIALTGWVFASKPYKPTTSASEVVLIQKAV